MLQRSAALRAQLRPLELVNKTVGPTDMKCIQVETRRPRLCVGDRPVDLGVHAQPAVKDHAHRGPNPGTRNISTAMTSPGGSHLTTKLTNVWIPPPFSFVGTATLTLCAGDARAVAVEGGLEVTGEQVTMHGNLDVKGNLTVAGASVGGASHAAQDVRYPFPLWRALLSFRFYGGQGARAGGSLCLVLEQDFAFACRYDKHCS